MIFFGGYQRGGGKYLITHLWDINHVPVCLYCIFVIRNCRQSVDYKQVLLIQNCWFIGQRIK